MQISLLPLFQFLYSLSTNRIGYGFKISVNISGDKEIPCLTSDFNRNTPCTGFQVSIIDFRLRYIFSSVECTALCSYF